MASNPQPVFIFGYTHSGTSLLQDVLRKHPEVYSQRSESAFYQFPYHYIHDYPSLDTDDSLNGMILYCANLIVKGHRRLFAVKTDTIDPGLLTAEELATIRSALPPNPPHRLVFPATFSFLAERAGKRIWVEKTPDHTQQAARILRELPGAKAIEIVRDARDILASKKLREQRMREKLRDGSATPDDRASLGVVEYDPFWNSLAWRSALRAVNTAREHTADRVLSLRYEDLTATPEATVRRVCDFLGIEYHPEMLETERANIAGWDKMEKDPVRGIVASSVGRWHTTLSRGEKALANRLLGHELREHGYPVTPLTTVERAASVATAAISLPKIVVRVTHKLRARGLRHTVNSLANYARRVLPDR